MAGVGFRFEDFRLEVDYRGKVWCPCSRCKRMRQQKERDCITHIGHWGLYNGSEGPNPVPHPSVLPRSQRRALVAADMGLPTPVMPQNSEDRGPGADGATVEGTEENSGHGELSPGVAVFNEDSPPPDIGPSDPPADAPTPPVFPTEIDDILEEELEGCELLLNQYFSPLDRMNPTHEHEDFNDHGEGIDLLERDARVRLYPNSNLSRLSVSFRLLNMQSMYSMPNYQLEGVIRMLDQCLPDGNTLPKSLAEMRKLLKVVGLDYERIHRCPAGCVLYRKDLATATQCPNPLCNKLRYRTGVNGAQIARSVLWYLPLAPRLIRRFAQRKYAAWMQWHAQNRSSDNTMRFVFDSPAWKHAEQIDTSFASDPRHVRLGLATDGVNPYGTNRTTHSIWPVLLINYNIPPWIAIRKGHLILSMLISGPKKPDNMDIMLEPLVEELEELWAGVPALDAAAVQPMESFNLRAMVLWTITDWPGLGAVSHFKCSGYACCHRCGPDMHGRRGLNLRTQKYQEHRRYLPMDDPIRQDTVHYSGVEIRGPPIPLSVAQWRDRAAIVESGASSGRSMSIHRWSVFFRLPYWEHLMVRYLIDPMHVEANCAKSVIKHLYGHMPRHVLLQACREAGVHTWLTEPDEEGNVAHPPWEYSKNTLIKFNELLHSTRFPTGYGDAFQKSVDPTDPGPPMQSKLKSHDYHRLIQDMLPAMLVAHGQLEANMDLVSVVCDLSKAFRWICQKEIRVEEVDPWKEKVTRLLVDLERVFPPSFFDIQVHLIKHLVDDVAMCGPVHARWMYFVERFMGVIRKYVKHQAYPEGSIVKRHLQFEGCSYTSDVILAWDSGAPVGWQESHLKREWETQIIGASKTVEFSPNLREHAHTYLLLNHPALSPLRDEYFSRIADQRARGRGEVPTFLQWLDARVQSTIQTRGYGEVHPQILAWVAGPEWKYKSFKRLRDGQRNFRSLEADSKFKTYNAGVYSPSIEGEDEEATVFYCGEITELLEVTVGDEQVVMIAARWFDPDESGDNPPTVADPCGFYRVNTSRYWTGGQVQPNPFVLPDQVEQCFFVSLGANRSPWKMCIPCRVRYPRKRVLVEE